MIITDDKTDLKNVAILCLAVGWVTFPFIMCLIAYEEKYVKYVVAKHPKDKGEENGEEEDEALEEGV